MKLAIAGLLALAMLAAPSIARARSLELVRKSGTLGLCAHPASLPFASKTGDRHGFQVELGEALAKQMGLALEMDWIVVTPQIFRTDCDIVLDTIADEQAQAERGLKLSKPYYRTGVALVVPKGSPITGMSGLSSTTKVGVQQSSLAAMTLSQHGIPISVFGYESDMLEAVASGEVAAAAVTPTSAGWWNMSHPDNQVTVLPPDESQPDLVWNVAIGMRHPDDALRDAINAAIQKLRDDGTVERIYASYGVTLQAPKQ